MRVNTAVRCYVIGAACFGLLCMTAVLVWAAVIPAAESARAERTKEVIRTAARENAYSCIDRGTHIECKARSCTITIKE